ncbi:MAG: DUF4175 domain-containing protein, partial [Robiginitomaculum sp.]|nr:DUF4175 domain-containing protein [Robiginitomaculum sp.]
KRPHSIWAKHDILALRVLAVLSLFAGFIIAGSSWSGRIETAFYPGYLHQDNVSATVEAWVNAPEYAVLPPLFLSADPQDNISVLAGSEFVVRVTGVRRPPLLSANGKSKSKQKLTELSDGVYEGRIIIEGSVQLSLSRSVKANWVISQRKDTAPVIEFAEQPKANEIDELEFTITGSDDFGIEQAWLLISTDEPGGFTKADKIELVTPQTKELNQTLELDLTQHVLAGLPVILHLEAIDGAGQISTSKLAELILPEKLLIQPLAKAVAEQRLMIMRSPEQYVSPPPNKQPTVLLDNDRLFTEQPLFRLSQAPAKIQRAAALMRSIMRAPEIGIKDPYVWLGLSYVQQRLRNARNRAELDDLELQMWQISLRAEGGELETAAAAMRLAEKALQNGLLLGADPSELQRLSQKYEMTVKRYLQALAKQAVQQQAENGGAGGNTMTGDQLQEMLKTLQELTELGAINDARALLKALAELLRNLQMQMAFGGQGDGSQNDIVSEAMRKALEELGEMLGQQREILDQAQQQNNAAENGEAGQQSDQGSSSDLAKQQGGLQGSLNELGETDVLQGSKAKAALDGAETAMGEAKGALQRGNSEQALSAGQEALGQLREGAQTLAGEMLDRRESNDRNRDPFGRQSNSGLQSAEGGLVPDMIDPQQARKILQELRKRAAEQRRSKQELEYLDRLLERF